MQSAASPLASVDVVNPARMRSVLSNFPSGVVVITASGEAGPLGFTCQAFFSLSLEPALVSIGVSRSSKTWAAIREVKKFCVNVLSDDQMEISSTFGRSGADKFKGISWTQGPERMPMIEGACAWVGCSLLNEVEGGDHTIAIGKVVFLHEDEAKGPLLFHRGRYGIASKLKMAS